MIMFCQLNAKFQGLEKESYKWGLVVHHFSTVAHFTRCNKMHASVDLVEVGGLINWMSTTNSHLHTSL